MLDAQVRAKPEVAYDYAELFRPCLLRFPALLLTRWPSRRRSSACAAARPRPPARPRTRRSGLPWRSRGPSAAAGGEAPRHADDHPRYRGSNVLPDVPRSPAGRGRFRPAGSRGLRAKLAQQVVKLGPGRRFRAKAPRRQPEASSACPRCQGSPRAAGSPVPGPTAAWVTTGATGDTHPSVREGLTPSRKTIRCSRRAKAQLSSLAIPSLSPRRSGRCPGTGMLTGVSLSAEDNRFPLQPRTERIVPGVSSRERKGGAVDVRPDSRAFR